MYTLLNFSVMAEQNGHQSPNIAYFLSNSEIIGFLDPENLCIDTTFNVLRQLNVEISTIASFSLMAETKMAAIGLTLHILSFIMI